MKGNDTASTSVQDAPGRVQTPALAARPLERSREDRRPSCVDASFWPNVTVSVANSTCREI